VESGRDCRAAHLAPERLKAEVSTPPMRSPCAAITLRVSAGHVLAVVDDHIPLELDEIYFVFAPPPNPIA
jgi:hypothetical protein